MSQPRLPLKGRSVAAEFVVIVAVVLESGLRRLLAHAGLEGAVNAELGYTAGMAFYLSYYMELAQALLDALGEPEGPYAWPDPPRG